MMRRLASPPILWAAWARVSAGSGMAGADGISVAEFAQHLGPRLEALSQLLAVGQYRAQPLRAVSAVRDGRMRPRGLPTVADRVVQRAVLQVCGDRLRSAGSETSFAYQRGRSWVDALRQARGYGEQGLRSVFRTDIADFFASIDHDLLHETASACLTDPSVVDLVRGWITAPALTATGLMARSRGIPEGAPISPALANLFLRAFDAEVDRRHGRLVRYADDLALFCTDLDEAALGAEHMLGELSRLGLLPNLDKTYLSTFDAGFRMLGWVFRGDSGHPEQESPHWTHPLVAGNADRTSR